MQRSTCRLSVVIAARVLDCLAPSDQLTDQIERKNVVHGLGVFTIAPTVDKTGFHFKLPPCRLRRKLLRGSPPSRLHARLQHAHLICDKLVLSIPPSCITRSIRCTLIHTHSHSLTVSHSQCHSEYRPDDCASLDTGWPSSPLRVVCSQVDIRCPHWPLLLQLQGGRCSTWREARTPTMENKSGESDELNTSDSSLPCCMTQ
jgi:hypothetical protein